VAPSDRPVQPGLNVVVDEARPPGAPGPAREAGREVPDQRPHAPHRTAPLLEDELAAGPPGEQSPENRIRARDSGRIDLDLREGETQERGRPPEEAQLDALGRPPRSDGAPRRAFDLLPVRRAQPTGAVPCNWDDGPREREGLL
jgi:hypothetical protein